MALNVQLCRKCAMFENWEQLQVTQLGKRNQAEFQARHHVLRKKGQLQCKGGIRFVLFNAMILWKKRAQAGALFALKDTALKRAATLRCRVSSAKTPRSRGL